MALARDLYSRNARHQPQQTGRGAGARVAHVVLTQIESADRKRRNDSDRRYDDRRSRRGALEERACEVREHSVSNEHAEEMAAGEPRPPVNQHDVGERELRPTYDEPQRRVEQRATG